VLRTKILKFNSWLMYRLANINASAWVFYALVFLVIETLNFEVPKSPLGWINFCVQTLYQGAALPLCAFVAKVEGQETRRMIREMHEWLCETKDMEHEEIRLLHEESRCPFLRKK
jgi:hypothetical protein